jgi:hypothetical protein
LDSIKQTNELQQMCYNRLSYQPNNHEHFLS